MYLFYNLFEHLGLINRRWPDQEGRRKAGEA